MEVPDKEENNSSKVPLLSTEDRRLWIGNLDPRVTEYQLLKLVQKYGTIEKFDLILHRTGPLIGQPRGYAFVTYTKEEDAFTAMGDMNNMLLGQKSISVKWAHTIKNDEVEKPKQESIIPALAITKESDKKADRISQIQAIEAKLKMMEKKKEDELKINDTVATKPSIIVQYQQNKTQMISSCNNVKQKLFTKRSDKYNSKPYSRTGKKR